VNVRVEKAGNRILLKSERPTPGLKQSIPGAYFRQDMCWSVPLDLTTCFLLREKFGNRLVIGPLLTAWAREELAKRADLSQTAASDDASLEHLEALAPKLAGAMGSRRYQRAAVRFVADTEGRDGRKRALIADTVGLGKTAEALGAVLESGATGPFLVVCPKTAVESAWAAEIRRWLPEDGIITIPEGRAARDKILDGLVKLAAMNREDDRRGTQKLLSLGRTWVIVHPAAVRTQTWWICGSCGDSTKYRSGMVQELDCGHQKDRSTVVQHDHTFPQLFKIEWGAVVADESDQMLIKLKGTPNLQRRGMEMLRDLVPEGGVRIAMSGTPFRSKPHQIWSTLNWLDPVRWSGKWAWLERYWKLGGYSGYELGEFMEEREQYLTDELKDIMIRRTREEVRGDLPPKLYPSNVPEDGDLPPGIWLPMTPKQRKLYEAMERSAEVQLEGGTLSAIGVLAELTRLKQFAGATGTIQGGEFIPQADGNKFEWLLEFLRETGFPDKPSTKVIVASQFTKLLNAFRAGVEKEFSSGRSRIKTAMITGEVSGAQRPKVIEEFEDMDSGLDLIFINTKAGGSAITLDAAEVTLILDETWVDDEQQQLEGRSDNRNPERKIVPRSYYYLRSLDTVEVGIAINNAEAKRRGTKLLDGARNKVDFAKSVIHR